MALPIPEWKITAADKMILRNENFTPMTETVNGVVRPVMVDAYRYITFLVRNGSNLFTTLTAYAQEQANDGFFDR